MHSDRMTAARHLAGDVRKPCGRRAEHEEGGAPAESIERVEHSGRSLGMWSVVEREGSLADWHRRLQCRQQSPDRRKPCRGGQHLSTRDYGDATEELHATAANCALTGSLPRHVSIG